jgi:hypothetical protein
MAGAQLDARIELQAAKMAIEWTSLFAHELAAAARQAAIDSELVTEEHYRQALPIAASRFLAALKSPNSQVSDVNSRAA